jgi:chemotaxis protein MotA
MRERHKIGQGWFTQAGIFAPTFGIIGAVFGLMATMAQLNQPAKVGEGIAGAFVATFWVCSLRTVCGCRGRTS